MHPPFGASRIACRLLPLLSIRIWKRSFPLRCVAVVPFSWHKCWRQQVSADGIQGWGMCMWWRGWRVVNIENMPAHSQDVGVDERIKRVWRKEGREDIQKTYTDWKIKSLQNICLACWKALLLSGSNQSLETMTMGHTYWKTFSCVYLFLLNLANPKNSERERQQRRLRGMIISLLYLPMNNWQVEVYIIQAWAH